MALESLRLLNLSGHSEVQKPVQELQGLKFAVVAGATANTKIDIAAIRSEDTVVAAVMFTAGVPSDILPDVSIVDTRATGTVTAASVAAADTVTVNGRVFTFVANGAAVDKLAYQVEVGTTNTITAANLAAAINNTNTVNALVATSAAAVVTLTANVDGTAGNSLTLATSNGTRLAKSGTTLSGGTATGGVKFTSSTAGNQVLVSFFDKK